MFGVWDTLNVFAFSWTVPYAISKVNSVMCDMFDFALGKYFFITGRQLFIGVF